MAMYALVPVRVKITGNTAAEIDRAQKAVAAAVELWQEACAQYKEFGEVTDEMVADKYNIEQRRPDDAIEVVIDNNRTHYG